MTISDELAFARSIIRILDTVDRTKLSESDKERTHDIEAKARDLIKKFTALPSPDD